MYHNNEETSLGGNVYVYIDNDAIYSQYHYHGCAIKRRYYRVNLAI